MLKCPIHGPLFSNWLFLKGAAHFRVPSAPPMSSMVRKGFHLVMARSRISGDDAPASSRGRGIPPDIQRFFVLPVGIIYLC